MKLTASHFLSQAYTPAAHRLDVYDRFVQPDEALAKSAALEAARREAERLAEEKPE